MRAIKWQYQIIDEYEDDTPFTRETLNNMGEEGGELVSVVQMINTEPDSKVSVGSWLRFFFKKPLRD